MVLTSSARAPPTSVPTSLTHQEVACLKTALALVVIKRRLESKTATTTTTTTTRRRLPDQQDDDENDDGNPNSSMELESSDHASSMTNQLCPWMPLLGGSLQTTTSTTAAAGAAWMNPNRIAIPGTTNGNGSHSSASPADWVHMDHFMGLALQRAALTFEATVQQNSNNGSSHNNHNHNHNDKGPLTALTTHLAHQLVRMNNINKITNNTNTNSNNNNNKRTRHSHPSDSNSSSTPQSSSVDSTNAISDWIRATFGLDSNSNSTTQSNASANTNALSLHLQTVCIVWHGMLTAQPVELPVLLLPVLVPILQQALDESTSFLLPTSAAGAARQPLVHLSSATVTNDIDNDNNNAALYLQLLEHALHQAPTETVETVVLEALTPAYCWPVALSDLAANYEWKRRRSNSSNHNATNIHTHTHTTAGGALLLRYGISSILQQTMLAHHQPHYQTPSEKHCSKGNINNSNSTRGIRIRGSREM